MVPGDQPASCTVSGPRLGECAPLGAALTCAVSWMGWDRVSCGVPGGWLADCGGGRSPPPEEEEAGACEVEEEAEEEDVYKFLKRQIRWSGIPISFRIFHSLL